MTQKMNTELKTKWLEALRSGKYQQGKGALYATITQFGGITGPAYCCLGVLCEVEGMPKEADTYEETWRFLFPNGFTHASDLGVWGEDQGIGNLTQALLVDMNDQYDKSFEQIADWIEENL